MLKMCVPPFNNWDDVFKKMHSPLKIKLTDLNPHLTCIICNGYFVNATTITECLHSFCRSCIVKYLETNKYCPICEVQIHKTKPLLNLRSDQTLQDIVYKLVPGLFKNEMHRRKEFYASHPNVTKPTDPELSGELSERGYIYTSDDYISLSLEYYNNNNNNNSSSNYNNNNNNNNNNIDDNENENESSSTNNQSRRYLRCPAAVSILHLQKLIRAKYGLTADHKIDILYQNDALCEDFTLIDVAYKYLWKRKGPLHLTYRIFETECRKKIKLNNDYHSTKSVKQINEIHSVKQNFVSSPSQPQLPLLPSSQSPQMEVDIEKTVENNQTNNSIILDSNNKYCNLVNTNDTLLSSHQSSIINNVNNNINNMNMNMNNNTVKRDNDKHLDEVVIESSDATSEVLVNFPPDKEVQLQISETGIISITTSIASSDITQTVTVTTPVVDCPCPPPETSTIESTAPITIQTPTSAANTNTSTSTCITCLTVTQPTSTMSSTVIPNILLVSNKNKKSDLKSVRKINTNVSNKNASITTTTSTTSISNSTITTNTKTTTSNMTTSVPVLVQSNSIIVQCDDNAEQRKRKLSTDSAEANGNMSKKSANEVPFNISNLTSTPSTIATISESQTPLLKPSKLTVTVTTCISQKTSISTIFTSNTHQSLKTTTVMSSTIPKLSVTAATARRPVISQQTDITLTQPPVSKLNVRTSKFDKIPMLQTSKASNVLPSTPTPTPTKKNQAVGYKTLRDPPKTWNPQLPLRTHSLSHPYSYNSSIAGVEQKLKPSNLITTNVTAVQNTLNSSNNVPSVPVPATKLKPNKFFKVRNNIPRYLGNPASGVKPMYQISIPQDTQPITTTPPLNSTTKTVDSKTSSNQNAKKLMANSGTREHSSSNIEKATLSSVAMIPNPKTVKESHDNRNNQKIISNINTNCEQSKREDISTSNDDKSEQKDDDDLQKNDVPLESSKNDNDQILTCQSKVSAKETALSTAITEVKTSTSQAIVSPIENSNNTVVKSTEINTSKTEVITPIATLTNDKTFQQHRNSVKMSLNSRNSPMTVSEMLQLRNSPKTSSTSHISKPAELQKEALSATCYDGNCVNICQNTNTQTTEKTEKGENTENVTDTKENVQEKYCDSNADKSMEKEKSTKSANEIYEDVTVDVVEKDKQQPSSVSSETEKSIELKISQTTVPIYSPRFKSKNDSKFQKNIASNLRIDVSSTEMSENNPGSLKIPFNSQISPLLDRSSPKSDKNSPKATSKIVPASPKFDRDSPKNLLGGPKSPKTIAKTSPTLQVSPIYDHMGSKSTKAQLSPQMDRMSPKGHTKINHQMFKMSPATSKSNLQMNFNYDNISSKNVPKGSPLLNDNSAKSPTVLKNMPQLSPKTLTSCKTDLNVPSQKFNFMPPNPFIPNLSSPNLNPNQFLFPNYTAMSGYDPRLLSQHNLGRINNSLAYHNLPLSLSAISLANHNLPLSFSSMLYNQHHRLAYPSPTAATSCSLMATNSTLSPTTAVSSIASVTTTSTTSSNSTTTIVDQTKQVDGKTIKPKDKNANNTTTDKK